jgi:hypothetical protein
MSEATFHLKLLCNYQLVTKPGTYYVTTAFTVTNANLIADEHPRYIVPFRALTALQLQELLEIVKPETRVPFSELHGLFLSGALWAGENDLLDEKDLPIKGEKVLATFEYVERPEGTKLLCTHVELLPREELDYVDVDKFDEFRQILNTLINKSIT